ncbi:MAG TPA: efflux RND transporter permease subunit [Gemmatimonadales bacterium]
MIISDYAIKRPLITIVAMLALVVFGLLALANLKTDEFPEVVPPFVSVGLVYPGASPDGVESEVLDPVEEQIRSISGVRQVMGKAYDGYALFIIEFEYGKNLAEATQEIRDAISGIRNDLPVELEEPVVKKLNDTDTPIVSLAVSSTALTPAQLTRIVDPGISGQLRAIPGVAEVIVFGKQERELTVQVRPSDLQAAGVSVAEVVQALQLQNLAAPVGRVTGALDERSIRLRGRLRDPSEFEQLVVAERDGQLIRLGQVADVLDGTEEPRTLALFNTQEAVGIGIKKARGYSTTEVSDRIRERVDQIQERLPDGTRIEMVQDAGTRVERAVNDVKKTLLEGALLTVLVVFLFLNSWRSTVITGLALPVSVLAAFIAVWALGFRLETMSLLGLSLAIGILIDDAIVVRENIVRHVEMGKDHYTAAREGTDEIGLAVAATTFSILAVFVPIGFMPGLGGEWFKPFALTIACAVLVSLFVSFSLDPMLSAYWPDPHREEHEKSWLTRVLDRFNNWFNRRAEDYRHVIGWALDHRKSVMAIAVLAFVSALAMPAAGIVEGGFFPEDDRSEFIISIETPPGSNLDYTRLKAEELAAITRRHPEVLYTYTTLGDEGSGAVDVGNVYVRLVPTHERGKSAEELARELRGEADRVSGVTASVFTQSMNGGRKQLQFQLRGADIATLTQAADQVVAVMRQVPGTVDIGLSTKGQKPELEVELHRGVAGSLGITVGQVAQSLRPAFAGIDAGDWEDPSGEQRDVVVRLAPEARRRAADLAQLPLVVTGPNGLPTTLPLGQVATVRQGLGPAIIDHLDGELVVTVEANVTGRGSGDVTNEIATRLGEIQLPPGVRWSLGGESKDQAEVFGQIFTALGAAILLMYLILVVQFGSFLDPVAILVSLPLSLIGVMLALWVTGNTLNIMSMIAIILLAGIVAKNAILLIDFAKWARERNGMPLREALIEAGAIRLRPIIMTTVALVAGMLPVALGTGEGSQFRAPLGVAVIGGVITSTFLTLLVIPTVYEIFDGWRAWVARRLGFVAAHTAEHRAPLGAPAGD